MTSGLNTTADFLKTEYSCHLVVLMNPYNNGNECNKNKEKALAARTKNIDVIVSSSSKLKQAITYIIKNTKRHDVILNYQGMESNYLQNLDISFNSKMEKISFSVSKAV